MVFYIDPVFKEVKTVLFKNLAVTCGREQDALILQYLAVSCHLSSRQIRVRISPACPRSVDLEWPVALDQTILSRQNPPLQIEAITIFDGDVAWPAAEDIRNQVLAQLKP